MNRTISWPDKSLTAEICCAAGVLQDLETAAVDGLLAMPRTGLGIGGLLLGTRGDRRIDVLRVLGIPCSHALGPAFVLTAEEIPAAGWRCSDDGSVPGAQLASYELVGCYWSKPNGSFTLTDYDHVLFQSLCPEQWQVALVIRPILGSVTTAAFGFRGDGGKLILGVPSELIRKQECEPNENEASVTGVPYDSPPDASPRQPDPTPVQLAPDRIPVADPVIPVAMPMSGTLFGEPDPVRRARKKKKTRRKQAPAPEAKRRWPGVVLTFAILLVVLATSAFFTRDAWLPRWRAAVRTYLPDRGISK